MVKLIQLKLKWNWNVIIIISLFRWSFYSGTYDYNNHETSLRLSFTPPRTPRTKILGLGIKLVELKKSKNRDHFSPFNTWDFFPLNLGVLGGVHYHSDLNDQNLFHSTIDMSPRVPGVSKNPDDQTEVHSGKLER